MAAIAPKAHCCYASIMNEHASTPRQLSIRSDEAHRLAHEIAKDTGRPIVEVVLAALRLYGNSLPKHDDMNPTQRVLYEQIRALSREAAKHRTPFAGGSDHSDLYDEFGLPI